jgi:putative N6-adenine-specific DNA methylase
MEQFFLECTPGLESVLAQEVNSLGFETVLEKHGVSCAAPLEAMAVLNRQSRIATRVALRLGAIVSPQGLASLHLDRFSSDFKVEAPKSFLAHLKHRPGAPALRIFPHHKGLLVELDTSGAPLYQRGYRQEIGRAPLRETLAAGILALAQWSRKEPLWDVMCGSGTFVIEAAEMALGLSPGRQRAFAFEDFALFQKPVALAPEESRERLLPRQVLGTDVNAGALGTARRNAQRAQVFESLTLERLNALQLTRPLGPPGLLVANLPYGKRVGEQENLSALYRKFSNRLVQQLSGWRFALLVQDASALQLNIEQRVAVSNGGLPCQLLLGRL